MSVAHLQQRTIPEPGTDEVDLDEAPATVAWEITRADVQGRPDPRELTTDEGYLLVDRLTEFGSPTLVFTGGDPWMRPDLLDLVSYADEVGLWCALAPGPTVWPTKQRLRLAALAGVRRVDLTLDGPCPEVHDAFRKVPGSWERTVAVLRNAEAAGLGRRVITAVARHNVQLVPDMVDLLRDLGTVEWSVRLLAPQVRAPETSISREDHERMLVWLDEMSRTAGAGITVATAPVCGQGRLFVSHLGDIKPSGALRVAAGNVRTEDVVDVYRNHPQFRALRGASAQEAADSADRGDPGVASAHPSD